MPNQADYSQQIRDALAVSDPAMSTGLGTPQRKIIEAVSLALAQASTEYSATYFTGFLDSYSGTDLDAYVEQFGFSRHQAGYASGTVVVRRDSAANQLDIPYGTTFYKPSDTQGSNIYFSALVGGSMAEGVTSLELPVVANVAGSGSNVAAHTVIYTDAFAETVRVDNPNPMTGGFERETDAALKERFRNTLFRNMAGTTDQYLGLAMASAFVSRARVVDEVSDYSEIVTVEEAEDGRLFATAKNVDFTHLVDTDRLWVKRLSDDRYLDNPAEYVPYSFGDVALRDTQTVLFADMFVTSSNGATLGPFDSGGRSWLQNGNVEPDSLSLSPIFEWSDGETAEVPMPNPAPSGDSPVYSVVDDEDGETAMCEWAMCRLEDALVAGDYVVGDFEVVTSGGDIAEGELVWAWQSRDTGACFAMVTDGEGELDGSFSDSGTWVTSGGASLTVDRGVPTEGGYDELVASATFASVSLYRCEYSYMPVQAGDFVELSMQYISNRWRHGENAVDLYVDGDSLAAAEDIAVMSRANVLDLDTTPTLLSDCFKREDGENAKAGNGFVYLTYQPVRALDDAIAVGMGVVLYEGIHYWLVHEVERADSGTGYEHLNRGSERASDFVELNFTDETVVVDGETIPNVLFDPDGIAAGTPIHIGYVYNTVPETVQELVEAQTPVCTDLLVHEANRREVEVNLTVMYTGYMADTMANRVEQAVIDWANALPFGSYVQLSDIETVVANLAGVDNVRTTTEADDPRNFGIVEYWIDGVTEKQRFTNDFPLALDEQLVVNKVNIITKTQQGW